MEQEKPTKRLEFGDPIAIEILQLEKEYDGTKPIETSPHDCGCEYCEIELEKCPYCGNSGEDQFDSSDKCYYCGKKCMPYHVKRRLEELKKKLLK